MKIDANAFWERFDLLMKEKFSDLVEFCEMTGLNYNTMISQRARKSIPKIEQLLDMTKTLDVPLGFLISGEENADTITKFLRANKPIRDLAYRLTLCDAEQLHCVNSLLDTWRIDRMPGEAKRQGVILA